MSVAIATASPWCEAVLDPPFLFRGGSGYVAISTAATYHTITPSHNTRRTCVDRGDCWQTQTTRHLEWLSLGSSGPTTTQSLHPYKQRYINYTKHTNFSRQRVFWKREEGRNVGGGEGERERVIMEIGRGLVKEREEH